MYIYVHLLTFWCAYLCVNFYLCTYLCASFLCAFMYIYVHTSALMSWLWLLYNLHSYSTKPELKVYPSSNFTRGMLEIRNVEDLWQWSRLEKILSAFRRFFLKNSSSPSSSSSRVKFSRYAKTFSVSYSNFWNIHFTDSSLFSLTTFLRTGFQSTLECAE